jgi:4-amino-4-deoxy-L-arabinose transferase-like glycosyltransferase
MTIDQRPALHHQAKFARALYIQDILCLVTVLVVVAGMYLTIKNPSDIFDGDSSRDALNGAFVLDVFRIMPLHHPVQFAYDYYGRLPGLTIGFYPPLFFLVLAVFYAIIGVSAATALSVEAVFFAALICGAFWLSRNWLSPLSALAVSLLLIAAPQLTFWSRQILLDAPAYALLMWSAVFLVKYMKSESRSALFGSVLCLVAAVATKYNAMFFAIVIAVGVVAVHGKDTFRNKTVWSAAALGAILLLPLVAMFFVFSKYNLLQAASLPHAGARWSIAALTFYAMIMPAVVSWPPVVLAC